MRFLLTCTTITNSFFTGTLDSVLSRYRYQQKETGEEKRHTLGSVLVRDRYSRARDIDVLVGQQPLLIHPLPNSEARYEEGGDTKIITNINIM